jgi:DNA-directed RNA polymerase
MFGTLVRPLIFSYSKAYVCVGKGLAKVPPETLEHLVDPPMPEEHTDPAEKSKFIATIQSNAVQRANNHSERCNVNYKLEIAKAVSYRPMLCPMFI